VSVNGGDEAFASALELAEQLRAGAVSSTEVVTRYLDRIEELNPRLDAYLAVASEQALEAARDADTRLGAARRSGEEIPPFLGVPISIKDLFDTAGIVSTHGTATWFDRVPDTDDEVVARVRRAGFVILGKTNTPEFGSRSTTRTKAYPPGRNPWDPERSPGGSSGGAAAALAAGLCPISLGSDGGGSIRIPSAWCGTFGLKPSRGRVSAAPGPQSWNATSGPITRTVADSAALLDAICGYATGDSWWAPPPARPFLAEVGVAPGRLRIAWSTKHPDPTSTVEPAWVEAAAATATLLTELGHEVVEADPPVIDVAASALVPASSLAAQPDLPPVDSLDTTNRTLIAVAGSATAIDLATAERSIQADSRRVVGFFADHDVLLTPTLAAGPPPVEDRLMGDEDWEGMLSLMRVIAFTPTWNMTGQPAVAVPAGFDAAGMPVSIQLVGRPADEVTLLRLAAQLEEARPWRHHRPPIS
jgi:amidase